MPTAAKVSRPKPKGEANRWWARAAYNGQDRAAALAALRVSELPLKLLNDGDGLLSAMARGDALMKGALNLRPTGARRQRPSAQYLRLIQWRLVMAYAGFEILVKAVLGRHEHDDKKGLIGDEVRHLTEKLELPEFPAIESPKPKAAIRKWLQPAGTSMRQPDLVRFLKLNRYDEQAFTSWLNGMAITTHAEACLLAKALRNSTAHGFLSPTKCHSLGLVDAFDTLPRSLTDIRLAVVCRLYEAQGHA